MTNKVKEILSTSTGKIAASRLNRSYFEKVDQLDLWNSIVDFQNKHQIELRDAAWYLFNDVEPTKCLVCDNISGIDRSIPGGKPKRYCSKECQFSDPNLPNILRDRKSKTNHAVANAKRAETMMLRYGVTTSSQRPEIRQKLSESMRKRFLSPEVIELLDNKQWLEEQYIILDKPSTRIAEELGGIFYGTVLEALRRHDIKIKPSGIRSYEERTLMEFIQSIYKGKIEFNTKNIIPPFELDAYLPDLGLAIEYNGLFWHSEGKVERGAIRHLHKMKTDKCEQQGIQLIQVNGDQWLNKTDVIRGYLRAKLGANIHRVYARKAKIVELTNAEQLRFFNSNHLQGSVSSKIAYGLIDQSGELVFAMSFGIPRYNKQYNWEILRLASKINYSVVGGASKILKHFRKLNIGSIITYADRQISNGAIYKQLGFRWIRNTDPGYYWTDGIKLYHRSNFMKHTLQDKLKKFDSNLSEHENMVENYYRKYYDSGQAVFIKE